MLPVNVRRCSTLLSELLVILKNMVKGKTAFTTTYSVHNSFSCLNASHQGCDECIYCIDIGDVTRAIPSLWTLVEVRWVGAAASGLGGTTDMCSLELKNNNWALYYTRNNGIYTLTQSKLNYKYEIQNRTLLFSTINSIDVNYILLNTNLPDPFRAPCQCLLLKKMKNFYFFK